MVKKNWISVLGSKLTWIDVIGYAPRLWNRKERINDSTHWCPDADFMLFLVSEHCVTKSRIRKIGEQILNFQ